MELVLKDRKVIEKITNLENEKEKIIETATLNCRDVNEEEAARLSEIDKNVAFLNAHINRTYVCTHLNGLIYKEFFEKAEKLNGDINKDSLNELIDFVCKVYGNKFSVDDFLEGVELDKMLSTIVSVFNETGAMIVQDKKNIDNSLQNGGKSSPR
ncbi:MAG: phage tail assembly chaperone G [Romboutsia timonensis]